MKQRREKELESDFETFRSKLVRIAPREAKTEELPEDHPVKKRKFKKFNLSETTPKLRLAVRFSAATVSEATRKRAMAQNTAGKRARTEPDE